jgi:gliding motility-associated-like protein
VKDNLKIEELLKDKFDSFEVEVPNDAWVNIQKGINPSVVAQVGKTSLFKSVLISTGIIAAAVTGVYLLNESGSNNEVAPFVNTNKEEIIADNSNVSLIHVENENDPIITENKVEIEKQLKEKATVVANANLDKKDFVNSSYTQPEEVITIVNNTPKEAVNDDEQKVDQNQFATNANQSANESKQEVLKDKIKYPSGKMSIESTSFATQNVINFISNAQNFKSVRWDFGDGKIAQGESVTHKFENKGDYEVKMTVFNGENLYEETQVVHIITKSSIDNIPNVITPNGDRINDYFAVNTNEIKSFYIAIMDENGNLVYENEDPNFKWDGSGKDGSLLSKGMYSYVIIAEGFDGSVFKIPGPIYIQ